MLRFSAFREMLKTCIPLVGLLFISHLSGAQNSKSELLQDLKKTTIASNRLRILLELSKKYYDSEWNYANKKKVDSALIYLTMALKLSHSLRMLTFEHQSLTMLGEYYFRCDNIPIASKYFMTAINHSKSINNKQMEAEEWYNFAERTPFLDTLYTEKENRYKKSLSLYKELGNISMQITVSQCITRDEVERGDLDIAEIHLRELLELQKSIGDKTLFTTYDQLAIVQGRKGNYQNAISLDLEALKSVQNSKDMFSESRINARLGRWNSELGQLTQSLSYNSLALQIMEKILNPNIHQQFYCYSLLTQIVRDYLRQNKPSVALDFLLKTNRKLFPNTAFAKQYFSVALGDCYAGKRQYKMAETSYKKAIGYALHNGRRNDLEDIYILLSELYISWKKYDLARKYIDRFFNKETIKDVIKIKKAHLLLFKVDSAAGNFLLAIKHYQINRSISDSLFSEKKSKQIEELQVQYQTAKKEQDILLLEKQARIRQNELRKANLIKRQVLGGAIIILLLTIILFYAYTLKKRSNIKLKKQQDLINQKNYKLTQLVVEKEGLLLEKGNLLKEKEWLLKEIHHRVKNNLSVVIGLLYSQSVHLTDLNAIKAIKESQQRIYSINLIHEKLCQAEQMDILEISGYINDLICYMGDSMNATRRNILISTNIEQLNMKVGQAIPLGLIINEAVTNAIKYAFPTYNKGKVQVTLNCFNDFYHLSIQDNGIGFDSDYDPYFSNTMGMGLMQGLTEQLGGQFKVENNNGVIIRIVFPTQIVSE
ncbi:tetratricopeptide repeat-containing sensor histidine kinase [Pedobacter sp.]|jgi:two-component sensor histidine kinase|uniref:tetratricopeptide repeat-containing sensor histidine kinase n=1 Tax=Pedobacter sp. TaxID=1411316 RepID=UPI002B6B259C|nr:histidine kinase dimerization/phosphoacceptor domain -containing protein [Pedobacter sp.]HWW40207.1 histidine kinase dimerization/phosphoacceptor domain -containing protein [Pedobacter sp.]